MPYLICGNFRLPHRFDRVAICWLVRDRGQSLRRSLDAWLSEMLPTDITQEHTVYSWIAGSGAARALSSD